VHKGQQSQCLIAHTVVKVKQANAAVDRIGQTFFAKHGTQNFGSFCRTLIVFWLEGPIQKE